MKYCENCATQNLDTAKFCTECGADLNTTAIKVYNGVDGAYYPGGDNIFISEGTWAVQYSVDTNEVKNISINNEIYKKINK